MSARPLFALVPMLALGSPIALVLSCACDTSAAPPPALAALEAEGMLESELVLLQAQLDALRPRQASKTELEDFVAAEKRLEKAPSFGGAVVWSAIAPPVLQSLFRAAGEDVKAAVAGTTEPPEAAALPFSVKVTPAAAALPLARRLADETGSRPTALITRIDGTLGLVEGRFPLDPLPVPPDPPRPPAPKRAVPSETARGPALAAEVDALRAELAGLTLGAARAEANRARVVEYDRRVALFQAVGDRRESQRVLLAAAAGLPVKAGHFAPDDLALVLELGSPAAATRALRTLPPSLAGTAEGALITLRHVGAPPKMPGLEARAKSARERPIAPPPGAPRPISRGLPPGR